MIFKVVIERPVQVKPGRYKSRVVTRLWWLWFAIARIHVSEEEYATTAYDWRER